MDGGSLVILFQMNTPDQPDAEASFSRGVILQVARDRAKIIFRCRDAEGVASFLQAQWEDASVRRVVLQGPWKFLAKCIGDGSLEPGAGTPPLSWCFLGGRAMPSADDRIVNLVRPDSVQHVGQYLDSMHPADWLRERAIACGMKWTDADIHNGASDLKQIGELCLAAGQAGSALVFTACR